MNHEVELIEHRQLNDGQVAILARCCGDQSTHSWLTMAAEVAADPVQREESINFHCERVATLHHTMQQALERVAALVGTSIQVVLPIPAASASTSAPQPTET